MLHILNRRELITLLGGAAATWPMTAHAQQADRKRRIGILMTIAANDPEAQARIVVFAQALQALGWTDGRNARIDVRWSTTRSDTLKYAAELAVLSSDVILAEGSEAVGPLQAATRTIPIVFVLVPDPVGQGFVDSLARPGANVTGFTLYEFGMAGKWLQLLKEIAPRVTRAAVIRDSTTTGGVGQFAAIQSMAPSLGVEAIAVNVRDPGEIERTIADFGRFASGGLIVTGSGSAMVHRELIATLAARYKLPAVYWDRAPVSAGGLISYGADLRDQYRQAAAYVDRLLKGEQPVNLPVQAPTKYELVINLKTAKALGLDRALVAARPRRRGHRINARFAAIAHSRFWHECDIARSRPDFRFREKSGRARDISGMTEFWTRSGHRGVPSAFYLRRHASCYVPLCTSEVAARSVLNEPEKEPAHVPPGRRIHRVR